MVRVAVQINRGISVPLRGSPTSKLSWQPLTWRYSPKPASDYSERVVHPFVDFVARDGNVMCAGAEISARIVIHDPSLSGAALRGMEAENAAVADSWRSAPDCTRFLTRKITNSVGLTMPSCCSVVPHRPGNSQTRHWTRCPVRCIRRNT